MDTRIHISTHMGTYKHIHTDTQMNTDTHTHMNTHRDIPQIHTHMGTHTHTHRHTCVCDSSLCDPHSLLTPTGALEA